VALEVRNNTKYDALVTILAENNSQAKQLLGYTAFLNWQKLEVRSGESKTFIINLTGRIQNSFLPKQSAQF